MKSGLLLLVFLSFLFTSCNRAKWEAKAEGVVFEYQVSTPADKVWGHRTDKIEQALMKSQAFQGIEVDIFYNYAHNAFYVRHDAESGADSLSLVEFLKQTVEHTGYYYWFDFKNLTDSIALKQAKLLWETMNKYDLTSRYFIESTNTNSMDTVGAYTPTCFWIPTIENIEDTSAVSALYKQIKRRITSKRIFMLSARYDMYPFFEKYFPDYKVNLWIMDELNTEKQELLKNLAAKKNVGIILVDGNRNYLK